MVEDIPDGCEYIYIVSTLDLDGKYCCGLSIIISGDIMFKVLINVSVPAILNTIENESVEFIVNLSTGNIFRLLIEWVGREVDFQRLDMV